MKVTFKKNKFIKTLYNTTLYALRSIRWLIDPIQCNECNRIMPHEYVESKLGEWTMSNASSKLLCKHCVADRIKYAKYSIFGREPFFEDEVQETCDRCKDNSISKKFYSSGDGFIETRTCNIAWNNTCICKKCAEDIFRNGEAYSGRQVYDGKKLHMRNSRGLYFKNNKVQLFKIIK